MTALLATTLAFSSSAEAINLIGNLPANDFAGGSIGDDGFDNIQTAVGFTLPVGVGYQLDNIVLRLASYDTSTDVALLQIYADATKTSTSPLGATLQSVFFNNPTSNSDAASDFTFTPTANFTFAADTRYWLLVDATSGIYNWNGSFPAVTPTGVATFNSNQNSYDNGASYFNETTGYSFQVNATAVPFDFSPQFGIAVLGGGWLLRKRFFKK